MLIEQHILNMIQGVADVDPAVIFTTLNDAKKHVLNEGIPETDPNFDILHKYYTMHLLQLWGHIEDIHSEEVGDVKTTYAKSSPNAGETKWLLEYQRELAVISGP